jgi:hypothetical protein
MSRDIIRIESAHGGVWFVDRRRQVDIWPHPDDPENYVMVRIPSHPRNGSGTNFVLRGDVATARRQLGLS